MGCVYGSLFSEEEASADGKDEDSEDGEEEEEGAFISSRLVSFESILGLISEGADMRSDIGVGIGVGVFIGAGTGVCMRSVTELATTLAFVAPITVSTAARAS